MIGTELGSRKERRTRRTELETTKRAIIAGDVDVVPEVTT